MNNINTLKVNSTGMEDYYGGYGIWEVSTEQDVDGRKRNLGIFEGYLVNIAFYLADMSFYKLTFKKLNIPTIGTSESLMSDRNEVHISLDIDSKTWDLNDTTLISQFDNYLIENEDKGEVEYSVDRSNFFASVKVTRTIKNPQNKLREQALAKLTDEEKKALGII